jgi:hypothetical protein
MRIASVSGPDPDSEALARSAQAVADELDAARLDWVRIIDGARKPRASSANAGAPGGRTCGAPVRPPRRPAGGEESAWTTARVRAGHDSTWWIRLRPGLGWRAGRQDGPVHAHRCAVQRRHPRGRAGERRHCSCVVPARSTGSWTPGWMWSTTLICRWPCTADSRARQRRGGHQTPEHACRWNLAPGLDHRGRVAPPHDPRHRTNLNESRLCRGPASSSASSRNTAIGSDCGPEGADLAWRSTTGDWPLGRRPTPAPGPVQEPRPRKARTRANHRPPPPER